MENLKKIEFNYSLKDIPLADKKEYTIKLYDAASKFINKLRWKVFFINSKTTSTNEQKEENIFKSTRSAPTCDELKNFEIDLFKLLGNIKFTNYKSRFQKTLNNDLKNILTKNKIILFADKTRNLYQADPKFYKKLVIDNLTKNYKISNDNLIDTINSDSKNIIFDRKIKNKKIPKYTKSDAFVTIKDHKPNFPFEIECRTLNP